MPVKKFLKKQNASKNRFWGVIPFNKAHGYSNKLSYDELLNAESELGRTLFGPIPDGWQREFFESKKNVWLWYERGVDAAGVAFEMTIRYDVRANGVYKRTPDGKFTQLSGAELDNFVDAVRRYWGLVQEKLYN